MKRLASLIAASLLAGSAFAGEPSENVVAHLKGLDGTVLVNQGEKFVTADEGQSLRAGDRVLAMDGAKASIDFTDGCVLAVEAGSSVVVPGQSTCAGAVAQTASVNSQVAQAVGTVQTTAGVATSAIKWIPITVAGATVAYMAVEVSDDRDEIVSE
ncbi:MAG TPA: hypothetical protein VFY12_01240 [Arenimonas sp.]|nr:hypothetical protein [Arenimonas sp.]